MDISLFDYNLPKELIADTPVSPRDHSRLLILDRNTGNIKHLKFYQIISLLTSNDVLVFNNTKVFPARLFGIKETGGKIEILLTKNLGNNLWQVMRKGTIKKNQVIHFNKVTAKVEDVDGELINLHFDISDKDLKSLLVKDGITPLPPYIANKLTEKKARSLYQTIYAKDEGSIAAPTAGFHFTDSLFDKILDKKIQIEYLTLHVGMGTFLPIVSTDITKHKMHSEWYSIERDTLERLNNAKKSGKRIISVGTTTTRVLEAISNNAGYLNSKALQGETSIFIYPPYKFKFVDSLITNFHLPKSTLLALVSAFTTTPNTNHKFNTFLESPIGNAYKEAIEEKYRFYSFGDASLIY